MAAARGGCHRDTSRGTLESPAVAVAARPSLAALASEQPRVSLLRVSVRLRISARLRVRVRVRARVRVRVRV